MAERIRPSSSSTFPGLVIENVVFTGVRLGNGADATVFEVDWNGTRCAAKRLHETLLEDESVGGVAKLLSNFEAECLTWSKLRHPGVVQFLGVHMDRRSRLPVLVMEKMDTSLRTYLENHSKEEFPLHQKAFVLCQVTQAMAYLHSQNPPLVHHDLSTNNILLNVVSFVTKVSDFGMSRAINPSVLTRKSSIKGTLAFMPPEALHNPPRYNEKLDVFSFGNIVLHTLTHEWPNPGPPTRYEGENFIGLTELQRREQCVELFTTQEKQLFLPIVCQCLENRPDKRPSSVMLVQELRHIESTLSRGGHVAAPIEHLRQQLSTKEEECQQKDEALKEKDEALKEKDEALTEKDEVIRDKDEALKEKDEVIRDKDEALKEKEEVIRDKDEALKEKYEVIREKDKALSLKDEDLRGIRQQLAAKMAECRHSEEVVRQKSASTREQQAVIRLVKDRMAAQQAEIQLAVSQQHQDRCERRESAFQKAEAIDFQSIFQLIKLLLRGGRDNCKVFGILVVGDIGAGKSTLIDNLLMKELIESTIEFTSETSEIIKFNGTVEGVDVVLYDTPSLGDVRGPGYDEQYLKQMKAVLDNNEIHLVLHCFKLTETRIRSSLIRTFVEYHRIGVYREHTVMVLTFADCLPVSSREKKKPGFQMSQYFNDKVAELHQMISTTLVETVGVEQHIVEKITVCPSTDDRDQRLLNGEQWFVPLWLNVLELLSPGTIERLLQMHSQTHEDRGGGCIIL